MPSLTTNKLVKNDTGVQLQFAKLKAPWFVFKNIQFRAILHTGISFYYGEVPFNYFRDFLSIFSQIKYKFYIFGPSAKLKTHEIFQKLLIPQIKIPTILMFTRSQNEKHAKMIYCSSLHHKLCIYVVFMLYLCCIYVGFMLDLCWIYVFTISSILYRTSNTWFRSIHLIDSVNSRVADFFCDNLAE